MRRHSPAHRKTGALAAGTVLGVIIGSSLLLALGSIAQGHGSFNWIMRSEKMKWCCGITDCATIPTKLVRQTTTGWAFRWNGKIYRAPFEGRGIYISKDHHFHACFNEGGRGSLRCFFHPVGAV